MCLRNFSNALLEIINVSRSLSVEKIFSRYESFLLRGHNLNQQYQKNYNLYHHDFNYFF